jgi:hypothetical protein
MPQIHGKQLKDRSVLPDKFQNVPWKESVRAATTGSNINLASAPANIDGVALSADDRVLVKDQTDQTENGIYVFNGAGSAMTRATDANTTAELNVAAVGVIEGATNATTYFEQTTANPNVGVSNIVWDAFGGDPRGAGDGLELVGNNLQVKAGDDSIEVDADGVKAAVPYVYDKDLNPLATSKTDYQPAGIAIDRTPAGDSYVEVNVNGVQQRLADGDRDAGDCYFSDDAGATAKAIADIVAGDALYWNGAAAGFKLDADDVIDLNYNVVQATGSSSSLV